MLKFTPDFDRPVRQVIRQCGQPIQELAKSQFVVEQKGPSDYVTSIDRLVDQQLGTAFAQLFPQDGVVTEENAGSRSLFHQGYPKLWLIDPLDGTEDFIQGKQDYAVMAGLLENGEPVAGWVYAPAYDMMYFGGKDWGVFQAKGEEEPQPIVQTPPPALTSARYPILMGEKDQAKYGKAIAALIPQAQFYSLGSFGLKVIEVICGRVGLYVYFNGRVKLWDTTGPLALAKTVGLVCCDLEGNPLKFSFDAIHPDTLAHYQPVVIGWPDSVEALLPKVRQAVNSVT